MDIKSVPLIVILHDRIFQISGDQQSTSLYVNGKLIEKMNRQTKMFNKDGKDKMYYVRTLTFPLAKAGQFKSQITNFKVVNYCK